VLFYCMDPRFYQKILQNHGFFEKKLTYLKSRISTKFHRLLFIFYFFSIFGIFFFYFTYPNLTKNYGIFCSVLLQGLEILGTNSGISKHSSTKISICKITFFSKFHGVLVFFLSFYYFWHFLFNFVYLYLSKNSGNFYVFLFYRLEILSKIFGKSWIIFLKNIDIWNPKFFINSSIYYLFFFQYFCRLFLLFHLIKPLKKF